MKKIITVLLIAITSGILIYTKPLNKINVVNAETLQNEYVHFTTNAIVNYFSQSGTRTTQEMGNTNTESVMLKSYDLYNNKNIYINAIQIQWNGQPAPGNHKIVLYISDTSTYNTDNPIQIVFTWSRSEYTNYTFQNITTPTLTEFENTFGTNNYIGPLGEIWQTTTTFYNEYNNTLSQVNRTALERIIANSDTPIGETLDTPTITINYNTITWHYIINADYYIIYRNNIEIGRTTTNEWVTIENGNYQVQACTNNTEEYNNSELSNTITQSAYNDIIGNGQNFFTLFTAMIDSQIYFITSMLNYEIWGINFYDLFRLLITMAIIIIIIKFITKGMG